VGCTLSWAAKKGGSEGCPFFQTVPLFSKARWPALLCSPLARPSVFCGACELAENSRFSFENTTLQLARPASLPISVIPGSLKNLGSVYFTAKILAAAHQLELVPPAEHSVSWHDTIRIKMSLC